MPDIINEDKKTESRKSRILWFIGLYLAGLIVTAGVVLLLRVLLGLGMK